MKVIRETTIAGAVIQTVIKVAGGYRLGKRKGAKSVTSEAVQKNNDKVCEQKLANLLNANFKKDDWHLTLTYSGKEPSPEEAKKTVKNFIRRMSDAMKKRNLKFKWIMVTEYENERIHHHFVTNAPKDLVNEKWNSGIVLPRPLDEGPDYTKLAAYLIKETSKTFRKENSVNKTHYTRSRNLVVPETKIEEVTEKMLFAEPKPWKGYYIDEDSIRIYDHPITGLPHVEYRMIAIDQNHPRIKKYYKGKTKTYTENYKRYINYEEEQLDLFNL